MSLFWMEMKKIFSWKIILLLFFVNIVLYFLLLDFEIRYFPNGRPSLDFFTLEQHMIPKYGKEIDDEEFVDFSLEYEKKVDDANAYIQADESAAVVGLTSYEDLRNIDENDTEQLNYKSLLMFERKEDLFWEIQAREHFMDEIYQFRITSLENELQRGTKAQQEHFEEILKNEKFTIYSSTVLDNFRNVKLNIAIIVFISIAILISPLYLRDKIAVIEPLQYSSKKGRSVYQTKWFAGIVSSIVLATLLLAVYLTIYASNRTASHFNLPLYTMERYSWYDMTFGQYIILSLLLIFVGALMLGILTMGISALVGNTIAIIGVQIVMMFLMIAGVARLLIRDLVSIQSPLWFVPLGYALFFSFVAVFMFITRNREKLRDII